jgi:tetratricopeptide (TPR) repeat protein
MFVLAEIHSSQRKYAEAEKSFFQLLEVQRRVTGPEVINTVTTIANIGWVRLQQKRYADAELSLREALTILARTAPTSWERFNVDCMLGASLAAQRKFEEAEPLLISGYDGMRSAERTTNAANTSRFTQDQAGDAIVQFYGIGVNPQSKPSGRKNSRPARAPPQHRHHRVRNSPSSIASENWISRST